MSNEADLRALASIVAAARTLVEDAALRGVREQPIDAPPATAAAPAHPAVPPPTDWSRLAADARATGLPKAAQLERVREELGDCRRCNLCRERRNLVFGVGTAEADLVVIGEAPGYHEDEQGEPFVGPAGQMLDKMLENVLGLRRDQVYILNVVKCRPPKNRNPLPDEVEACRPFLEAQLAAISPKVALVLGSVAFKTVFRTDDGITRTRGKWHDHGGLPVMPTFHPAYLLRQPQDKRLTFDDLKLVRDRYDQLGGRR
ncbi:MAG: uracil-DNA glycosylase [Myxococcota bacterium]